MSGTGSYLSSVNDCTPVQEVESFVVAVAAQTIFTLAYEASGDLFAQVNGSGRMTCVTVSGTTATYNPALNGGYVLQAGDEIEVGYMRLDCTFVPVSATVPSGVATGPEYPQTGDDQVVTPDYVQAALESLADDLLTPLAGVAALVAEDRGLSLGEVDIPTNRALTVAEMTQANAANVSIPLLDMQALFTNKAINAERAQGAAGVMNPDGGLGHQSKLFFTSPAAFAADIQAALDYNGAHVGVGFAGGETIVMPPARYAGQMLVLRFNATANREIIIDASAISYAGVTRGSDHRIRPSSPTGNRQYIYRPGEQVMLFGLGGGSPGWMVAPFTPFMLSGISYHENFDGTVDMWRTGGAAGVNTFTAAMTNTTYSVTGNGAVVASAKTLTGLTLSAVGDWHLEGGLLNYAALGGIASF